MKRSLLSQTVIWLGLLSAAGFADASDSDSDELKKSKIARIEKLEKVLNQASDKVRKKRNELSTIVDTMGTADPSVMNVAQQSAIQQLAQLRMELSKVRRERLKTELELNARTEAVSESETNIPTVQTSESDNKPSFNDGVSKAEIKTEGESHKKKDSQLGKDLERDSIASKLVKELELFRTQLEISQRQLVELTKRLDRMVTETTESLTLKIEILNEQEAQIVEEMKQLEQESKRYGRTSIDVEVRRKEIETLEPVITRITQEIERFKTEIAELDETNAKPR